MLQRSKWIKSETQKPRPQCVGHPLSQKAEKMRTYLDETSLKLKGEYNETP